MRKLKLIVLGAALASMCATASAFEYYLSATLSGPAESPPNASPGTGWGLVIYNDTAHTLRVQAFFENLIGLTTAAHIHGPTTLPLAGTAGVMTATPTFPGFPAGVTTGTYDQTFDLTLASSWNPTFITANGGTTASAEAAFAAALLSDKTYLNIHSSQYGGGEIRGFLRVPDAGATLGMLGLGFAVLGALRQRLQARNNL